MKKKDLTIITALRNEGRIPLTELSRNTGLPVSTIHERLKHHIANGLLKPTTLLGFPQLGFDTRAHILLGVDPAQKDKLLEHLTKSQHVNSLFRINSGWTAIMECVFADMYALENFIETIERTFTVRQKLVCYVLDELKREAFFTDPHLAEGLLTAKNDTKFKYTNAKKTTTKEQR